MKVSKKVFDELSRLTRAELNETGQERNNPVPILIRAEEAEESLNDKIRRLLRTNLAQEAHEQGYETFEESQDFGVDDEFDIDEPMSEYLLVEEEYPVMQEETVDETASRDPEVTPEEAGASSLVRKPEPEATPEVQPEDESGST